MRLISVFIAGCLAGFTSALLLVPSLWPSLDKPSNSTFVQSPSSTLDHSIANANPRLPIQSNDPRASINTLAPSAPAISDQEDNLKQTITTVEDLLSRLQYRTAVEFIIQQSYYAEREIYPKYIELLNNVLRLAEKQFSEQGLSRPLLDIYQILVVEFPQNMNYQLKLAELALAQNRFDVARTAITALGTDGEYAPTAKALESRLDQLESFQENGAIRIPLIAYGKQFLVNLTINNSIQATLLIDTGASITTIKSSVFSFDQAANKDYQEATMQTAGGLVTAQLFPDNQIDIGFATIFPTTIASLPLAELSADGLLGMNVLSQFDFDIDAINSELILRPK